MFSFTNKKVIQAFEILKWCAIRQIYNTSPGGGGGAPGGKLVPDSHKRCELGHTVIKHFSRGDQIIREVIPVSDRLWKETILYASLLVKGTT